jgi:hypothetical protein
MRTLRFNLLAICCLLMQLVLSVAPAGQLSMCLGCPPAMPADEMACHQQAESCCCCCVAPANPSPADGQRLQNPHDHSGCCVSLDLPTRPPQIPPQADNIEGARLAAWALPLPLPTVLVATTVRTAVPTAPDLPPPQWREALRATRLLI